MKLGDQTIERHRFRIFKLRVISGTVVGTSMASCVDVFIPRVPEVPAVENWFNAYVCCLQCMSIDTSV